MASNTTWEMLMLITFPNARLYRASDVPGRGWNTYGSGPVRISIVRGSDPNDYNYQGWGVLTFHNQSTGACGLNVLIVPNFTMDHSVSWPRRVTFKALSRTLGNNGKKNMYCLKLTSSEDAARLWYSVFVLQLAAKQARSGSPIIIPDPFSAEATVARAFIGTGQDEVDRQFVWSRLCQLATTRPAAFMSMSHQWSESFFKAPIPRERVQELGSASFDEHSVDGSFVPDNESFVLEDNDSVDGWHPEEEEYSAESTVGAEDGRNSNVARIGEVAHDVGDGSDDSESLGSNADFAESQDWFASFGLNH